MIYPDDDRFTDYIAFYSCVSVQDPRRESAIALIGVSHISQKELPEDQLITQRWNKEFQWPHLAVIRLLHITGETPESVVMRAAHLLDDPRFYLAGEKALVVDAELIDPEMVYDLPIDVGVDVIRIGGKQMAYDTEDGVYTVPMRDIVSSIVSTYGRECIGISQELELAETVDQLLGSLTLGQEELEPIMLAIGMGTWKINMEHKRTTRFLEERETWGDTDDLATWGLE